MKIISLAKYFSLIKKAKDLDYLIKFLLSRFPTTEKSLLTDKIEKFLQTYNNNFEQFIEKQPTLIGKGSDGWVFEISNDKILKFFNSPYAFQSVIDSNKLEYKEFEPKYYDVDKLGKFNGEWIYYYVQEKLKPLHKILNTKEEQIFMDFIFQIEELFMQEPIVFKVLEKELKLTNDILELLTKKINNKININLPININKQNFIKDVLIKKFTNRHDITTGNIGLDNLGNLKIFDSSD